MDLNTIKIIESYIRKKGMNIDKIDFLIYLDKLKEECKPIKIRPSVQKKIVLKKKKQNEKSLQLKRKSEDIQIEIEIDKNPTRRVNVLSARLFANDEIKKEDTSQQEILNKQKKFPIVSEYTGEIINNQNEFLQSKHWAMVKVSYKRIKDTKNKKNCEKCGSTSEISLHHLTYKNMGKETPSDLMFLCGKCHCEVHDRPFTTYANYRKERQEKFKDFNK